MLKNSKLSGYRIKKTIGCFCIDIEAGRAALLPGLNRNTVNRWHGLFRRAIHLHQSALKERLIGSVEVDGSRFGARRARGFQGKRKRGRGTLRQPVSGVFEREGRVYTEIVPDCKKRTLQRVIRGKVSLESIIHSDGWRGYNGLVDPGCASHFRVRHGKNESARNGHCHINGVEAFRATPKGGLQSSTGSGQTLSSTSRNPSGAGGGIVMYWQGNSGSGSRNITIC